MDPRPAATVDRVGDATDVVAPPDRVRLSCRERLIVSSSAAADIGLRTAAASLVTAVAAPVALSPGRMRQERRNLRFYGELAEAGDAARSFPRPTTAVDVTVGRPDRWAYRPPDGHLELLRFESPFVAQNPELRDRYARFHRNRTAWAQYWRHDDGPRPTLCVIHGFMASPYWLNRAFFSLPWFYGHGYDVLLYTLPFHGLRRSPLTSFNGQGYFAHGIAHFNEAMAHALHDLRLFLDHLEAGGVERIGLTGLSLGGYTTALLAAVEDRLHIAIPNAPVINLVDLVGQWFPAGPLLNVALRLHRISTDGVGQAVAVHSPLTYAPVVPVERRMIIGGLGDRLAPPDHSRQLWHHWDHCRLHWFLGTHTIHIDRGVYLKEMGRFMVAAGFAA
ncbi:MAG: alpha/beta hydrolase family protein [Acidimicrobiales bacterium]